MGTRSPRECQSGTDGDMSHMGTRVAAAASRPGPDLHARFHLSRQASSRATDGTTAPGVGGGRAHVTEVWAETDTDVLGPETWVSF